MDQAISSTVGEDKIRHPDQDRNTVQVVAEHPSAAPAVQNEKKAEKTGQFSQSEMQDSHVEVFQHRALEQYPAGTPLRKVTLHMIESTPSVPVVKEGVFVLGPSDGMELDFKKEPEDPPESMSESDSDESDENFPFPQPFLLPKKESPDENQSEQQDNENNDESGVHQTHKEKNLVELLRAKKQLEILQKAKTPTKTPAKAPAKAPAKTPTRIYNEQELLDRRHFRSVQKLKYLDRKLKELETSEAYKRAKKNLILEENVTKKAFVHYFKGLNPDFQKLTPQRKDTYLFTLGQCVLEQMEQECAENE